MKIKIERVTEKMYQEIFHFEVKNKAYFEKILPPRPDGYQQYDTFKTIMDDLLSEQLKGEYYMHIIRDENSVFVGRINLQMSGSGNLRKAELGYRVDFEKQGNGYASQAVKLILKDAFENHKVIEITAGTSKDNIASQRVLEKNAFKKIGEEKNVMKINKRWIDGILYSIKCDGGM